MKTNRIWLALALVATSAILGASAAYAAGVIRTNYSILAEDWSDPGVLINDSVAVTKTTDVLELRSLLGMSVQVTHGNITGTLVMQGSNDCTNFYTVQDVTFAAISGAGGELVEIGNLRSLCYRWMYTHSSGTGPLLLYPFVKGK